MNEDSICPYLTLSCTLPICYKQTLLVDEKGKNFALRDRPAYLAQKVLQSLSVIAKDSGLHFRSETVLIGNFRLWLVD